MDFTGNVSDQSEDLFSDDDGTGDVDFTSPDAKSKSPILTLSQTPILFGQQQEETPDRAIVPKTPLTLAPFISKADAWTSDLETPEIKRHQLPHYSQSTLPDEHDDSVHDVTLTPAPVLTPLNTDCHLESDEANEEIVPPSQEQPRKSKRRPKRRIFHKNSTNYSALHENDDSDESIENNPNIPKKSQSCIEYTDRIPLSPVQKIKKLRELQRKLRKKNQLEISKNESAISDDEFVKVWRTLEMCDRVKPSNQNFKLNSSSNKKEFNEQIVKQSTLLPEESSKVDSNDIFSPIDLGIDEIDQEDDVFHEKTFAVDENEEPNTKTINENNETEEFRGFSTSDQKNSELLLSKFQRNFKSHYVGISPKKLDFHGFTFVQIEIAKTIAQNNQIFYDNYLEKYYGIVKNIEEPVDDWPELPILPPLIVKVYSEFDTASGKKLFTAVEKVIRAQTILLNNEDVLEHSIDRLVTSLENQPSNERDPVNDDDGVRVKVVETIEETDVDVKNVESNILRAANSPEVECDNEVPDFKVPMRLEESVPSVPDSNNFTFVGFQTGLGKRVKISESALSKAAVIYGDSPKDYDDCLNELSNFKTKINSVRSKQRPDGFKPLLPKPAPFKSVVGENFRNNFARKPFYSRQTVEQDGGRSAVVNNGVGMLQNKVKLHENERFEGMKTKGTAESSRTSLSTFNEDEFDEHWNDAEDFSELKLPDLPAIEGNKEPSLFGFMTGTGKTVKISEEALSRGRAMYAAAQKEAETDCQNVDKNERIESTPVAKDPDPIESSGTKKSDFNHLKSTDSTKRKNSTDDVTPFGRKRAKIGGSDLQGRVLFSEIDEEDRELIKSAMIVENRLVNERLLPFKNNVIDEVKTGLFNNFDKNCHGRRSENSYVASSNKDRGERRPHSFPHSKLNDKLKNLDNNSSQDSETIPDDLVFDSQEFLESYAKISAKLKLNNDAARKRSEAIQRQEEIIQRKKIIREKRMAGALFQCKKANCEKIKLEELCYSGKPPVPRSSRELVDERIDPAVLSINSSTAESYQFNLPEFNGHCAEGIALSDGATLIPNDDNKAGITEFKRSFLASPGVDPLLVPHGWIENHYKWIVWKLASMDRVKFSKIHPARLLTPDEVLKQLKYRYDREIDNSERSIIRKILEKDGAPSNRMVLLVSKIIKLNTNDRVNFSVELTDGWYSVMAALDTALINYIHANKLIEGTKLMIYGAQLINLEEGCHPLEIPDSVRLKIHGNSTRRAKWFAKLGLQKFNGPMELNLKDVNRSGGLIGKVTAIVSRVYPILYRETFPNGEIVFRNVRSEERAQIAFTREQEARGGSKNFRHVKPCLKIRVTDNDSTGIVTIWQNAEECSEMFKEGYEISIIHGSAVDKRNNEMQINATRWTTFDVKKTSKEIDYAKRIFTPLSETMISGFNPIYGEFDTVGIIVSIGPAPHGMKNFETVNLAYRNESNEDSFLSILFWQGLIAYGYNDIATVGAIICCLNCEWRRKTYRSIPTAFCSERTIITRNPKQGSHLKSEFDALKIRIGSKINYVDDCAMKIHNEVIKKSGSTPNSYTVTPNHRRSDGNCGDSTPKNGNSSVQSRLEKLQWYGSAPKLTPINLTGSRRVSLDFRSPLTRATRNDPSVSRT